MEQTKIRQRGASYVGEVDINEMRLKLDLEESQLLSMHYRCGYCTALCNNK